MRLQNFESLQPREASRLGRIRITRTRLPLSASARVEGAKLSVSPPQPICLKCILPRNLDGFSRSCRRFWSFPSLEPSFLQTQSFAPLTFPVLGFGPVLPSFCATATHLRQEPFSFLIPHHRGTIHFCELPSFWIPFAARSSCSRFWVELPPNER